MGWKDYRVNVITSKRMKLVYGNEAIAANSNACGVCGKILK